jgi:hypothetical protein
MDRLRDRISSPDALTARAAELLSAMPPLDTGRLRPPGLPEAIPRRVAARRIRMGTGVAVLLGTVVAAAATVHSWPSSRVAPAPAALQADTPSPGSRPASRSLRPPTAAPTDPDPIVQAPEPSRASAIGPGPKAAQRDVNVAEDESTLMLRAVRALRREGDPARAEALAEQVLARFPHGEQVEEAMALVMEAASARGDIPAAQRAASAYLARFRSGRFADRAQRILASPAK